MELFNKFIIETDDQKGDCLIIAKCTYHKQLVVNTEKVKGGGWWYLDGYKKIILHGESYDFGRANIEDISNCIKLKRVFRTKSLLWDMTDDYSFKYKNEVGEIIDL